MRLKLLALVFCVVLVSQSRASVLSDAGYSVLPEPREVTLDGKEVAIDHQWRAVDDQPIVGQAVALPELNLLFHERFSLDFAQTVAGPAIHLQVKAGAVPIGQAADKDKPAIARQAYQIDLQDREIRVLANAPEGLFYGVQTLAQLAKRRGDHVVLPEGRIVDWPDLQLRQIYWDDAHHLEKLAVLKAAIRQAAFFKINGFIIKLEGHFQFKSAPALVEPQALSPAELQELTNYALARYVHLIPYLDAPGHVAFILKHPQYADLRAFPDCNYEFCTTNPRTIDLLAGMYRDLLEANRGENYFYLSTDEPYYVGMADAPACSEKPRRTALGSPGKLLAEFVTQTAGYLHDNGRQVVFWGEYPLKPDDVSALPPYLINGETNEPAFNEAFARRGIRQMVYTSTEGEEKFFPDYFVLDRSERLHDSNAKPRVASSIAEVIDPKTRQTANLMGVSVAGWADMGLHPETFWLGYATIASAGWNPATEPANATDDFLKLFYGPSGKELKQVYQAMSRQAQFWADSWESGPSTLRKPIWGYSAGKFDHPSPAHDQLLALPPLPNATELARDGNWREQNARRLELGKKLSAENAALIDQLDQNLGHVEFNRYNLDVFRSIAMLCRQNLEFIDGLGKIDETLADARRLGEKGEFSAAVARLDAAFDQVEALRARRNKVYGDAVDVWHQSWLPRLPEANGRKFLHELDDVKDHLPDRTIGMEYLIYRELNLPLDQWTQSLQEARNRYAASHNLPARHQRVDWTSTQ